MLEKNILEFKNVVKLYPGVVAVDHVSFSIGEGEVHAIMGENGAGKSTMIKMVGGAIRPTEGTIIIDGKEFTGLTPAEATEHGVGVIYQEFNLVPTLSVAENICLGNREKYKFRRNKKYMRRISEKILSELGLDIDPDCMVSELSTGQQQMVEIAKQMVRNVKILIMDEPTASLSLAETEKLLKMVETLKTRGVTILYISHRLEEVMNISDRVSIFRDGQYVATKITKEIDRRELIRMMVGRELGEEYPLREGKPSDEVVLSVKDLCGQGDKDICFELHKGEILGVAGLVGSGRTEMVKMLYGYLKKESGEIKINGKKVKIKSPQMAIEAGIGLIPEDRKCEGVFLEYPIDWNIAIMSMKRLSTGIFLNRAKNRELSKNYIEKLAIATPSEKQLVRNLSGGNQQKVAVAKTLGTEADILIFDEPTRGIDVGAKQEIYKMMHSFVQQGKSILVISSDMEEIIGISDRMMVFYEGKISGFLNKEDFNPNKIMTLASGIKEEV